MSNNKHIDKENVRHIDHGMLLNGKTIIKESTGKWMKLEKI